MDNLWSIVGSIIGGGLIGVILTWIISNRKDKRDGLEIIIDRYNEDNKRLRQELESLKDDFNKESRNRMEREVKLQQELAQLRSTLNVMESAHLDLPVPQWLKDTKGKMLALNIEYERKFLIPMGSKREDYINKDDIDIWDKTTSEQFARNDLEVMRNRRVLQTQELINFGAHSELWEVLKYPRYAGNILIGIGGIAFKKVEQNITPSEL